MDRLRILTKFGKNWTTLSSDFGGSYRSKDRGFVGGGGEAIAGFLGVVGGEFDAEVFAVKFLGGQGGGAAVGEGVEDEMAGVGIDGKDSAEERLGDLAGMPVGAFLERATGAGEIAGVFLGPEVAFGFLGAEDPGVVGEFSAGVGADVVVGGLASGRGADSVGVEGERAASQQFK